MSIGALEPFIVKGSFVDETYIDFSDPGSSAVSRSLLAEYVNICVPHPLTQTRYSNLITITVITAHPCPLEY
jgi:hypothetical protein